MMHGDREKKENDMQYAKTNPVAEAIRDLMGDMTISELAQRCSRARITVYRWICGQRSPNMSELPTMAKALNVSPSAFAEKIAKYASDGYAVTTDNVLHGIKVIRKRT